MNTDQYIVQQDSTPKPPSISTTFESTKSFLSIVRNSSATKSSTSQRLDSYDPECLSPLDIPSFGPNPFAKSQDSGHKHHLSQKLKVKVYNYFQEKGDTPYYPVSEEETPGYSVSTSVDTPQYIESAQLRTESEGSIPRQSSQNEILSQPSEGNSGTISREISETIDNAQTEANLVQAEPLTESQPVGQSGSLPASTENLNGSLETVDQPNQAANANNHEGNFVDSLEFVLEKTPIITIFMSLICLALTSGIAMAVIDGKESHFFIFLVLYVFLMYVLIEKVFRMLKACRTNSPTLSLLMQAEPFYNFLDTFAFIVIAIVIDLKLCETISSINVGLYSLIAVFSVYCACARLSFKEKAYGVIKRCFYMAQFLLVMYKLDNHVTVSWNIVLFSGWILLGTLLYRLVSGIYKVYKAFSGLTIVSAISKSAKFIGMLGLTLIGVDLIVLAMILAESCDLLDTGSSDFDSLKMWLTVSQYLNACLLFFTTITGTDLLEFILSVAEHFNPIEDKPVKLKELVMSRQETYVMRMSTTYYKIIEKSEIMNKELEKNNCEAHDPHEDNTCYICCGNTANGLVLDCGHGGTCYGCLSDYIKRKDECMECRKKVNRILKVESEVEDGKIYKGDEIWSIVRE